MINFDNVTIGNIKEDNLNWPQISNHLYRILIIGGSGSGKTNLLFNPISQLGSKHINDPKAFVEYSNDIN